MKFDKVCLVLTNRCTAACEFCGFSCSPENTCVMSEELMERLIKEAAEMNIKVLSFSGGEPFLYPDLLLRGARLAREHHMYVTVATNGFWGGWEDEKIKGFLTELRPDNISFSYDIFHRKYLKEEQLLHAVAVCQEMELKHQVYVADLKGEYSAGRFIHSLIEKKYGIEFHMYPAYRVGRAWNLPEDMFLVSDTREHLGCLSENTLSVLYNGDVYPCCRYQVFESDMKMGNVSEKTLEEVLTQSDASKICAVLANSDRFNGLLETAEELGIKIEKQAGCSCDYCRMLFGRKADKEKMMPYVEKMYGELLVKSLLRRADVDENVQ